MERRKAKLVYIGARPVGGNHPIAIQSMCNTKTEDAAATVAQILRLEKAGCDQLPTGSNCYNDKNLGLTVPFCRKVIAPERLKGFMTAPWCATRPDRTQKLINSIDQLMGAK